MPLFGLTPVPGALEAPAWTGSTHRGPCYVIAPDTRRARLHAANHFTDPLAVRTESGAAHLALAVAFPGRGATGGRGPG